MAIKYLLVLPTSLLKCIKSVFLTHRKIRLLIIGTAYQQKCKIAGESFDGSAKKKKERRKEEIQNKESLGNEYEIDIHNGFNICKLKYFLESICAF